MFKVYHFKRLLSTNEKAKEFKINSVVIADEQRFGKGRFSRRWSSGKGGVYLSLVLDADDVKIQYFTFVAAISVQKAIKDVYGIKSVIKWPNDLIYTNKKICGILTNSNNKKTIVGVGINTNNTIPKSLIKKGISLKKIINKKINNKIIINKILEYFEYYVELLKSKKYSKIINDWKKNSFLGSDVKVKTLKNIYSGIAYDIDKDCFLVIKDKKGKKIRIVEGDVEIV